MKVAVNNVLFANVDEGLGEKGQRDTSIIFTDCITPMIEIHTHQMNLYLRLSAHYINTDCLDIALYTILNIT